MGGVPPRAPASEFLVVKTDRVRITWNGPARDAGESRVRVLRGEGTVRASGVEVQAAPEALVHVVVPEEAILSLLVESLTGESVDVLHRDPGQCSGLVRANQGRTVHGAVRVRDEAGVSTFTFLAGGSPEAEVSLRVVPTKLGMEDVEAMRQDVESVWRGAALSAWSAADDGGMLSQEASVPAWLTLLRVATSMLERPLAEMARAPRSELMRQEHVLPASRLRGNAQSVRAARRQRGRGALVIIQGAAIRERLPVGMLLENEDVAAHRWIRQKLDMACSTISRLLLEEITRLFSEHGRRRALRADMEKLRQTLRRYSRQRPLANAVGARMIARPPLVLRVHPVYRRVFDALRLLEHGLEVGQADMATAWMGTARLYETWAVLRVVHTVADVLGSPPPEAPFGLVASGARVRVGRGVQNSVVLRGEKASIEVAYEPRFSGPPGLLAQRPDILLTLRAPGRPERRAVLDAKYRRDDSSAYIRRHGAPGPPEAALGDLHRYRDAIVDGAGAPLVEAVAALFPFYAPPTFENSRLWRAHASVGIGAIPLVPGDSTWLRQWLLAWVSNETAAS